MNSPYRVIESDHCFSVEATTNGCIVETFAVRESADRLCDHLCAAYAAGRIGLRMEQSNERTVRGGLGALSDALGMCVGFARSRVAVAPPLDDDPFDGLTPADHGTHTPKGGGE